MKKIGNITITVLVAVLTLLVVGFIGKNIMENNTKEQKNLTLRR